MKIMFTALTIFALNVSSMAFACNGSSKAQSTKTQDSGSTSQSKEAQ